MSAAAMPVIRVHGEALPDVRPILSQMGRGSLEKRALDLAKLVEDGQERITALEDVLRAIDEAASQRGHAYDFAREVEKILANAKREGVL